MTTAARIGNAAAGIAVGKQGTAVVHAEELSSALQGVRPGDNPKIVSNEAGPPSSPIGRPKG